VKYFSLIWSAHCAVEQEDFVHASIYLQRSYLFYSLISIGPTCKHNNAVSKGICWPTVTPADRAPASPTFLSVDPAHAQYPAVETIQVNAELLDMHDLMRPSDSVKRQGTRTANQRRRGWRLSYQSQLFFLFLLGLDDTATKHARCTSRGRRALC